MTCKDCIHDGVCHLQEMTTDLEIEEYIRELGCEDFKNKADFVEVEKVVEMLCKIKTNISKNVSTMIENDFNKIVKDVLNERRDT